MPILCAVYNCGNNATRDPEKRFFRFPTIIKNNDPQKRDELLSTERRKLWFSNINREDLTEEKAQFTRVCVASTCIWMSVSRGCLCCVKYLMFVFNLIFWLGGCGLFGIGVWLSFTQAEFSSLPLSFPSLSAANLLLVAGGITMVTGFLGCLGALKEQRCLLFMFFVILLLLVLTEVTLTLVIHIFHDKLDSKAQGELKEGMKIYKSEPGLKKSWDNVQKMDLQPLEDTAFAVFRGWVLRRPRSLNRAVYEMRRSAPFKCCGVTNKTDWYDVLNGTLPSSCCSVGTDQCVDGWIEPCYQKARQWLLDNIPSVLVFGVCIGVVQILALVFSMLMYCQILCAEKHLD